MSLFVEMKNEWNWKFHKTLKASSIDSSSQDNYTSCSQETSQHTRTGEISHFSTWESLKISQQMCPDLLLFGLFYLPHLTI